MPGKALSWMVIVAFYFSVMVPYQDWPLLAGPYPTWEDCASVREALDRWGYVTDGCAVMPYPQDSVPLAVFQLP